MTATPVYSSAGRVASLHLHPANGGEPLQTVDRIEVIVEKGIAENPRYFARISRSSGQPSKRQVSLIAREEIACHASALGLDSIAPGVVRSNIETTGIDLVSLIGRHARVGEAILYFYEPRTPCHKMDAICEGLKDLMKNDRQGVMAQVIQSGAICVGDNIELVAAR